MENIQIRPMEPRDLPSIRNIDQRLTGKERAPSWMESAETLWFTHRPAVNYVAELQEEVVGFLLGDIRGSDYGLPFGGWIDMVGVLPEYQRQGIAEKLAKAFCARCATNYVKVRVIFREDDRSLVRFFSSLGFKKGKLVSYEE